MIRTIILGGLLGIMGTVVPAIGQESSVPVTSRPPAPITPEERRAYRAYCGEEKPSASLSGLSGRMVFAARSELPDAVVSCRDEVKAGYVSEITSIDRALFLLSLKAYDPLWPQMEQEWGDDLSRLRAELRRKVDLRSDPPRGSRPDIRIERDLSRATQLSNLGYPKDALKVLAGTKAFIAQRPGAEGELLEFESTSVAAAAAHIRMLIDGHSAAASELERFMTTLSEDSDYFLNPLVNYAAILAEAGDHARSLETVERAYANFRRFSDNSESYPIGGVEREFYWIMACNHAGLGNSETAQEYIDRINRVPKLPPEDYTGYIRGSSKILRRLYRCMNESEAWYAEFLGEGQRDVEISWIALQPAYRRFDGPLEDWTVPESVAKDFESRYRILPDSYAPALGRWRDEWWRQP